MFGLAFEGVLRVGALDVMVVSKLAGQTGRTYGMEHFWGILTKPDNLPIVGMLLAVIFCLSVAFRQALKHDKLIAQGKKDEIYGEMIK
jgi:hypothetical protein